MIKYDLHDSLIEKINYFAHSNRLEVRIELCNWKQRDYKDSEPEMLNICIVFDDVEKYELSFENYVFCNNEILDVIEIDDRTIKIIFLVESDVEAMIVKAKTVSYTTN